MSWFDKDIQLARQSLEKVSKASIDHASDRLDELVQNAIERIGTELQSAIREAGGELDQRVERIAQELHQQRALIRSDAQALVEQSADTLGKAADARLHLSRTILQDTGEQVRGILHESLEQTGTTLRGVVSDASREIDAKLDKIAQELHSQRQFTKDDVKDVVDYAALKLGTAVDERIHATRLELATLVNEKIDVLKQEIDHFFIRRQQDLARERRRLVINVTIAVTASVLMAAFSLLYHHYTRGGIDIFGFFRVIFISLTVGYGIYLGARLVMRYVKLTEHRKDVLFFAMRYVGVLHPESIFSYVVLLILSLLVLGVLLFPDQVLHFINNDTLNRWIQSLRQR